MRVFSEAFHTSYQYALASAFPEIEWYFVNGIWANNRPMPINVHEHSDREFEAYDIYLAHGPSQYEELRARLSLHNISPRKIIYLSHWPYNPDAWVHGTSKSLQEFCHFVADSPVVAVTHFLIQSFGFYSHVSCQAIPHYVPSHYYKDVTWHGTDEAYINVVNDFFVPMRGVGAEFWLSLNEVPKKLYGANNDERGAGSLKTKEDFAEAASRARGYLWTGEKAAMSYAPLEAMACGCPVIAPDNADWAKVFTTDQNVLLYKEGDKDSLLTALIRYESDPELRERLSRNGRAAVAQRFSLSQFRAKWQFTLESALADW